MDGGVISEPWMEDGLRNIDNTLDVCPPLRDVNDRLDLLKRLGVEQKCGFNNATVIYSQFQREGSRRPKLLFFAAPASGNY
jgi:hypothetical protein